MASQLEHELEEERATRAAQVDARTSALEKMFSSRLLKSIRKRVYSPISIIETLMRFWLQMMNAQSRRQLDIWKRNLMKVNEQKMIKRRLQDRQVDPTRTLPLCIRWRSHTLSDIL